MEIKEYWEKQKLREELEERLEEAYAEACAIQKKYNELDEEISNYEAEQRALDE